MKIVTPQEARGYATGRTLTSFQLRLVASIEHYAMVNADLASENEQLRQRVAGLEEYQNRAVTKPTVLLVHDLGKHGSVTAYERGGVQVISETVYPWEVARGVIGRLGRQWLEAPVEAHLVSPYAETLSATRALELESKRATIQGCQEVVQMKEAIADAIDLIRELTPYRDKYLGVPNDQALPPSG